MVAKNYGPQTELSLKIIARILSGRLKLMPAYWVVAKHFFCLPHTQYAAKKPKTIEIRGNVIKKRIFFAIPKSPTQMGSLSVKNASEKFSRLGTFK